MDFWSALKKELIQAENENKYFNACGYYHTFLQHQDSLIELLDDCSQYNFNLVFHMDKAGGYTKGNMEVWLSQKEAHGEFFLDHYLDYLYEIEFSHDERYWGYCMCNKGDLGYNPVYKCCGRGCDWVAPSIVVTKKRNVANVAFEGYEQDMWRLRDEWERELGKTEADKRKEELDRLEKEIERLVQQRDNLQSKQNS